MYQESDLSTTDNFTRKRKNLMTESTIAKAARSLVKTMWGNHGRRPFYHPESISKSGFSADIQDLIKAIISVLPSSKSQKAITSALLRCITQHIARTLENNTEDHMADLIIRTFFFAMSSCKDDILKTVRRTIVRIQTAALLVTL